MKTHGSATCLAIFILLTLARTALAGDPSATTLPSKSKTLIDYFLPMPVRGQLSHDVWGAPEVGPRDTGNGLEDATIKQWCYWDGSIVKGADGKFHMFAS